MSRRRSRALTDHAVLFAALGDPTRLVLLERLAAKSPTSIAGLAAGSAVSRQAITKHLEVLSDAGLARSERVGRERLWRFEPGALADARAALDVVERRWDEALERLARHVERDRKGR
jgi:DNA-binding transcriptional ArsR family regulator